MASPLCVLPPEPPPGCCATPAALPAAPVLITNQPGLSAIEYRIGSFTSIQWHPGQLEGGNVYPFKIRKEPKRNIRVWLQDGANDLENAHGSWPLQNLQMANSLKMMGYDFHLTFGTGTHNGAQWNAQLSGNLMADPVEFRLRELQIALTHSRNLLFRRLEGLHGNTRNIIAARSRRPTAARPPGCS